MRERSELTGGTFEVSSAPGQGMRVQLRIPYPGVGDRDPVCGMTIGPDTLGAEYAGSLYRFCSPACRDLFLAQPAQYVVASSL
jgi:YHS domain-containing protein